MAACDTFEFEVEPPTDSYPEYEEVRGRKRSRDEHGNPRDYSRCRDDEGSTCRGRPRRRSTSRSPLSPSGLRIETLPKTKRTRDRAPSRHPESRADRDIYGAHNRRMSDRGHRYSILWNEVQSPDCVTSPSFVLSPTTLRNQVFFDDDEDEVSDDGDSDSVEGS